MFLATSRRLPRTLSVLVRLGQGTTRQEVEACRGVIYKLPHRLGSASASVSFSANANVSGTESASASSSSASATSARLVVDISGISEEYPWVWLRDNCQCPQCFEPLSQCRIVNLTEWDLGSRPAGVEDGPEGVEVTWQDGHTSLYDREWLRERSFREEARARYRLQVGRALLHLWTSLHWAGVDAPGAVEQRHDGATADRRLWRDHGGGRGAAGLAGEAGQVLRPSLDLLATSSSDWDLCW